MGSISRGTIDVTMPAPQKKEWKYLSSKPSWFCSHRGGCHEFGLAYQGDFIASTSSSRSETSHHMQPNQWQQSTETKHRLKTRMSPGLNLMIISACSRYLASLSIRISLVSLNMRSSLSIRLARPAESPDSPSSMTASRTRFRGNEPRRSIQKEPLK
eukprot:6473814-Prymnesium_polylepis.2